MTTKVSPEIFAAFLAAARRRNPELPVTPTEKLFLETSPEEVILPTANSLEEAEAETQAILETEASAPQHIFTDLKNAKTVVFNQKQAEFASLALSGKDAVMTGAAGTGKTTCMKLVTTQLLDSGKLGHISEKTKWLELGAPGAAILSYTRKAVNNIRKVVPPALQPHTLTIHKLLEFAPFFEEVAGDDGLFKKTLQFKPLRNSANPLPATLKFLAFEESSMISTELYDMLQEALPHTHQEVFLGDIQQLPPVFGDSIFGYKMLELPIVELTEIYRQAAQSPIITLAHAILSGDSSRFSHKTKRNAEGKLFCPSLHEYEGKRFNPDNGEFSGEVKFQIWQKQLHQDHALLAITKQFTTWAHQGYYDPEEDVILCPYNKAFGTLELNKGISQYLGLKRQAVVHEVVAGFNRHYLAIGDRVLFDKEDAFIVDIQLNGKYFGSIAPKQPSVYLDRWGHLQKQAAKTSEILAEEMNHAGDRSFASEEAEIDAFLSAASSADESDIERKLVASHVITIRYAADDATAKMDSARDINALLGGYALTVHKFQGSEADKVFLALHGSHRKMISRELLYTAVTRAKMQLHIICDADAFEAGVKQQRIKGNTLAEKAEFFKGKDSERVPSERRG